MDLTNIIKTLEIEDYSTLPPPVPGTGPIVGGRFCRCRQCSLLQFRARDQRTAEEGRAQFILTFSVGGKQEVQPLH